MRVGEVIPKHGVDRATHVAWKAEYANATVWELSRLRGREQENAMLATRSPVFSNSCQQDRARYGVTRVSGQRKVCALPGADSIESLRVARYAPSR